MANFCRVDIIGRLSRDPKVEPDGSVGAMLVYNPVPPGGEDADAEPVYIEVSAIDKPGGRRLASVLSRLVRGEEHLFQGRIFQKRWTEGSRKLSKLYLALDSIVYLHQHRDTPRTPRLGPLRDE